MYIQYFRYIVLRKVLWGRYFPHKFFFLMKSIWNITKFVYLPILLIPRIFFKFLLTTMMCQFTVCPNFLYTNIWYNSHWKSTVYFQYFIDKLLQCYCQISIVIICRNSIYSMIMFSKHKRIEECHLSDNLTLAQNFTYLQDLGFFFTICVWH